MQRFQHPAVLTALFVGCLSACATLSSDGAAASPAAAHSKAASGALLPAPSTALDLSVAQGSSLSLDDVLRRLSTVTGVTFSPSAEVAERLKATNVALSQGVRVAPAEVYPWIESILIQNGFSLALLQAGPAPLVGVYVNGLPGQTAPALHIEADQIEACRAHPAFMFTVVLTLPNVDVRSLGNSLRILSPGPMTGGVIPVGTTRSVILSGDGRHVADLADMLQTINAKAALPNQTTTKDL